MKIITKSFLQRHDACREGKAYFMQTWATNAKVSANEIIKHLISSGEKEKLDWANWLIARCLSKNKAVQYAVFAAELVLPLFEEKYPEDNRPRLAIEKAKAYIKKPCKRTKDAARAAARVAWDAAGDAAEAAWWAAARVAWDAAGNAAGDAAWAAARAAVKAAEAVGDAAYVQTLTKILEFGLILL